ncbi:MAG TPA: signal peptidase I [Pyrinomonadaceae bacterium]|nr:signal peptidase I [Pyrinomonadaceae bacterium]
MTKQPIRKIIVLLALFAACSPVPLPVKVEGAAMLPALKEGDLILIQRPATGLQRGDIVLFYYPEDTRKSYLKRIIGLPDETFEIRAGRVVINGAELPEPYIESKFNQITRSRPEVKIPSDSYFVLGDNRDNSNDSRMWGALRGKLIYGKFLSKYGEAK